MLMIKYRQHKLSDYEVIGYSIFMRFSSSPRDKLACAFLLIVAVHLHIHKTRLAE